MIKTIPLVGGNGAGSLVEFDAQLTENMYVEVGEQGSRSPAALVSRPGLATYMTQVIGTRVPAMRTSADGFTTLVFVQGATQPLRKYAGAGGPQAFGPSFATVVFTTAKVSIAAENSGARWAIAFGINVGQPMVFANAVNTGSPTVTASIYQALDVVYSDGRFIFIDSATGYIRHTDLNSDVINPLNFILPGVQAKALAVVGREVWVLGEDGCEVYYNDGSTGFAYARRDGASLDVGLHSPNAIAELDGTVYFLASDKSNRLRFVRINGYSIEPVSTPFIDRKLAEAIGGGTPYVCDAFAHSHSGHSFAVMRFRSTESDTSKDFCMAVDTGTGHWFNMSYRDADGVTRAFDGCCAATRDAFTLVGSATSGAVLDFAEELPTDNGLPFTKRRRLGRIVSATAEKHKRLELRAKTGVPYTEAAHVRLRWSDDGGRTFGEEHIASLGEPGEYVKRVAFRRLGLSRDRVYELAVTDSVQVVFTELLADVEATRT